MPKLDLYGVENRLARALESLNEKEGLTPANVEAIKKFVEWNKIKGNGVHRQLKYLYYCSLLSRLLGKDFMAATKDDLRELLNKVEDAKDADGSPTYKGETKLDVRITLKLLYRCLLEDKKDADGKTLYPEGEVPEIVAWVKAGRKNNKTTPRSTILENTDIEKIMQASTDLRERLFIALLFNTGGRITELASLRIKDIRQNGGLLFISLTNFKTNGQQRTIPIADIPTQELYAEYLRSVADRDNPEALLWGDADTYFRFSRSIRLLAKKAGITKPVNPHHFRHSRFTLWGESGFSEQELKYLGGWASSEMLGRYISSSYRIVEKRFTDLTAPDAINKELTQSAEDKLRELMAIPEYRAAYAKLLSDFGALDFFVKLRDKYAENPKLKVMMQEASANTFFAKNKMPMGKTEKNAKKQVAQPKKKTK